MIGAVVFGAWLASAAGITRQSRTPRPQPRAAEAVQFDTLAADVQAQAGRLRARLAEAPAVRPVERNPFSFSPRPVPRRAARVEHPAVAAPAPIQEIREPVLALIGIAEHTRPEGPVRTAMITGGHDELMMVTVGQRILSRYDVVAVSADAVELRDIETGAARRLILR
jgi:hypothetical protein